MHFPTRNDLVAEGYGLLTSVPMGGTDTGDIFIHGRDYAVLQPQSPGANLKPDGGMKVRHFLLMPKLNTDDTREAYISADRQKLFEGSLLGYPYANTVMAPPPGGGGVPYSNTQLWRHLPEPYRTGSDGTAYTFNDTRSGSTIERFELHATEISAQYGIGEGGQVSVSNPSTWTPDNMTAIYDINNPTSWDYPYEKWKLMVYVVTFTRLPYDVMLRSDPAYGGEFSRFLQPQEDPVGRFIQIRSASVSWNTDLTLYGQPANADKSTGPISSTEGLPRLTGDNNLSWKWLDVPSGVYDWNRIQSYFGTVNFTNPPNVNQTFPLSATQSPFIAWNSEVLLFRSAHRFLKPNIGGMPVYDMVFCFQASPGTPRVLGDVTTCEGNWNRLLNPKGVFQRLYAGTNDFYATRRFLDLFWNQLPP